MCKVTIKLFIYDLFLVKISSTCAIGDRCNSHTKAIGLTLDDILMYYKVEPNQRFLLF